MREPVSVVLVPGFWLGGWAWDGVATYLEQLRFRPAPVTLPGLAPGSPVIRSSLTHQIATVHHAVTQQRGRVVLVGHSRGATVINGVLDLAPQLVSRVVFVDDGPLPDGGTFDFEVPDHQPAVPMPSWRDLAAMGMSPAGIDAETRAIVRRNASAEPAGVLRSRTKLTNPRRLEAPTTVVCSSMSASMLRGAISDGAPFTEELAGRDLTLIDLPTGHWPMFSRPEELAHAIALGAR